MPENTNYETTSCSPMRWHEQAWSHAKGNNAMTTWHIYMPIESAERMTDTELENMFKGLASETRTNLALMKAKGMEVVPSSGCDKQDPTGRCMGHN